MIELDAPCRHGAAMVTLHPQAVQPQREWNPSQEVGHEDQAAVQNCKHAQILSLIIVSDLHSQPVESRRDLVLSIQHFLKIAVHQLSASILLILSGLSQQEKNHLQPCGSHHHYE